MVPSWFAGFRLPSSDGWPKSIL